MFRKVVLTFLVLFLFVGAAYSQNCVEPRVDNATFVVTQQVASDVFDGSETVTATTVENGICAGKGEAKSNSAFAFPISSDDSVFTPDRVDGATKGEEFYLESDGQSLAASFKENQEVPIQRTSTTYQDGAIYVTSSMEKLAADSSQIGFETDTLYAASDTAEVGMNVTLPEDDTLSGVQFDLVFDGPQPIVTKSHGKGTLNTNLISEDTLRVLLFSGLSGDVLPKQNVLTVNADVTSQGQTVDVINSVASLREGDNVVEVGLSAGTAPVFVQEGTTDLIVQNSSLSFSQTVVGNQTQEQITVENQGTIGLSLQTESDNETFSAESGIEVNPEETKNVTVNFSPKRNQFGNQSGNVQLATNKDTSFVTVDGTGVGGRGDPTLNGQVDVADVTKTADIILGVGNPTENEIAAADVYTVDTEGDGTVNITDLETTANAILSGGWKDENPLPSTTASSSVQIAANSENSEKGKLILNEGENKTQIYLRGVADARGAQFDIKNGSRLAVETHENIKVETGNPKAGMTRVLVYRTDGKPLSKDSIQVASAESEELTVPEASVADASFSTSKIRVTEKELVIQNGLSVYPNPSRTNTTVELRLKDEAKGKVVVYDVLGRKVKMVKNGTFKSGRNELQFRTSDFSSGVYFLRFRSNQFNETKKITVIR